MGTMAERNLLPTAEDVAHYREHGWYVTPKILSDDEMDELERGVERHYAGERDERLPIELDPALDWQEGRDDPLRLNDYVVLVNRELRKLLDHPVLGATAGILAGTSQIRVFQSGIVSKAPGGAEDVGVGWHTDRAYWQTCTSDDMLTSWIPLHDVDESMGTLTVLDGSHRWEPTPLVESLRKGDTFLGASADELRAKLDATGMPLNPVPIVLERGQVSFHHCLTFHGSGANRSDRHRTAVTVHFQDRDNRFRHLPDGHGDVWSHSNDVICRKTPAGDPDYSDPKVCPVVWEGDPSPATREDKAPG